MGWKKMMVMFLLGFMLMAGIITVDRECRIMTGEGGKIGLSLGRTAGGDVEFCFFGLEGEIDL